MKKLILLIALGFFPLSCSDRSPDKKATAQEDFIALQEQTVSSVTQETDLLKIIDFYQEIYLIQRNDKCGEWGGDKEQLRIYKNNPDGRILLDYKKSIINCEDPYSQKEPAKLIEKDRISSNREILELIEKSIIDLTKHKISTPHSVSHSGIANYIISKDSTILITHYPSYRWSAFQELTKIIVEK